MAKKKPVHQFRYGVIKAAIWENGNGSNGSWFTVALRRSYKDGDDWHDTDSLRRDDLPLAEKLLAKAFDWIWEYQNSPNSDEAKSQ